MHLDQEKKVENIQKELEEEEQRILNFLSNKNIVERSPEKQNFSALKVERAH